MNDALQAAATRPPSIDQLLRDARYAGLLEAHGRAPLKAALQAALDHARERWRAGDRAAFAPAALHAAATERLTATALPKLRPVFNLTGTVIHTNLGRAPLPPEAIAAIVATAGRPATLEFDLASAARGDRDQIVEALLAELTGAEAATVVNNNAAAVLLALKALAWRKEVVISRGEQIEIGGAFRLPDIMRDAGCKLVEIGCTNRTHARDYAAATHTKTGLVLKAHPSNYAISGFTSSVPDADVAAIAHQAGVPFMIDLGSGALVDLSAYGLPAEPVVRDVAAAGADVITFSGDKLLGGPQCGIIVGRRDLIARIKKHPLKRALRCCKLSFAALEATLRLYRDPDRLAARLPTLRMLARPVEALDTLARTLQPAFSTWLGPGWTVTIEDAHAQIGSGAQPAARLPSRALRIVPANGRRSAAALAKLETALRCLPAPVIGRVADQALWLDLKALDDPPALLAMMQTVEPLAG